MKPYNKNLLDLLELTAQMLDLSNRGDQFRQDKSCGILYGQLRDYSYKLKTMANEEIKKHKQQGIWEDLKS